MRADTTRRTFNPAKHYRQVLQQQGRVGLDAEWNEQREIDDHLRHRAIGDTVGDAGGPVANAGFQISAAGGVVSIGTGRYYVDGVMVENDATVPVPLTAQPDLPAGLPPVIDVTGATLQPATAGVYLAELDVWSRHVTVLDDTAIREVAVPVPDTTTRVKTVWQVRLVRVGAAGAAIECGTAIPAWSALRSPTTGRLAAQAQPGDESMTPCEVPAGAGFRGADNQHYRVEIRNPGTTGVATFVWSRENASVQARWIAQTGNRLGVEIPARDTAVGFAPQDWVELVDDRNELGGTPGTIVQIATVHDDIVELNLATAQPPGPINIATMGPNPKLRRWDGPPQPTGTAFVALERGVEVAFEGGRTFATGEYWSIPARTALHDVQWPRTANVPDFLRPIGPAHSYRRLAVLDFDGANWTVREDCRNLFPPLTSFVTVEYAGGDGQTAAPDPANAATLVPLSQQLRAAVTNGNLPVAGARVRFTVNTGNGRLDIGGGPQATVDAITGADGIAMASWSVDSGTPTQQVTARLVRSGGLLTDAPIVYTATLLRANGVTVDPSVCPGIAGATNVQQALEQLCATVTSGCASIVITPGGDWSAPIRALAAGSSARICFRPGEYHLSGPLIIQSLPAVVIDGAGDGSLIVADETEVALRFLGCAQVVIRDLAVQANVVASPGPGDPGQGGVITTVACDSVEITSATVRCAGGSRKAASCVNIQEAEQVTVRDCRLAIGHMQTGVIIVDGRHIRVRDNVLAVTRKSEGLSLEKLLADPRRRRRLVGQLVAQPLLGGIDGGGTQPPILIGDFAATFDSTISRGEWAQLIAGNPPTAADTASAAGVRNYLAGIADAAVADPARFPAVERRFSSLRGIVGANAFDDLAASNAGRLALRNSILGGSIDVVGVGEFPGQERSSSITRSGARVRFNSPVPTAAWVAALDAAGAAVTSDDSLKLALYRVADQVITDANFRDRFTAFQNWFQGLVDNNPASASLGVLCGGRLAEDVVVEGNTMRGVYEGVRVAVSHSAPLGSPLDYAGVVRIVDNTIDLVLPVEEAFGRQGIMVGNVGQLRIAGNRLAVPNVAQGAPPYLMGIRLHGNFGGRLLIEGNVTFSASIGVQVRVVGAISSLLLWQARDNYAPDGIFDIPEFFQQSNNVGL
jgi:Family of unknown function (DUF6519)